MSRIAPHIDRKQRAYNGFAFKWFHAATRILCGVCLFGRLGDCFGIGHCHMRRSFASELFAKEKEKRNSTKLQETQPLTHLVSHNQVSICKHWLVSEVIWIGVSQLKRRGGGHSSFQKEHCC